MDIATRRRSLIIRGAALIVVVSAWMFVRFRRMVNISGALWDDANYMISLDPEHYNGHVKDHPKDAEFLNAPINNYPQMEAIFAGGVATGRFAMGSNESLGKPGEQDTIDLEELSPMTVNESNEEVNEIKGKGSNESKGKGEEPKGKKRKRTFSSEDSELMI